MSKKNSIEFDITLNEEGQKMVVAQLGEVADKCREITKAANEAVDALCHLMMVRMAQQNERTQDK